MIEFLLAQNHHQPWHDPYVGQLVSCKPDPMSKQMVGRYTFDGESLKEFTFPKSPSGCPLRVTVEPRPIPMKKNHPPNRGMS